MDYPEAKRRARALFGQHGDAKMWAQPFFPFRVGVWTEVTPGNRQFVVVGVGGSWEDALADARKNQKESTSEA